MNTAQMQALASKSPAPVITAPIQREAVEPEKPVKTAHSNDNSGFEGLISGNAPDPSTEIETDTAPNVQDYKDDWFRPLDLITADNDNKGKTKYLQANKSTGELKLSVSTEEEFIDFWAVDAWEIISDFSALFGLDISEIETDEDELEQGRKAAKRLYKLSHKYPRWLGWMRSEITTSGSDMAVVGTFLAGKLAMLAAAIRLKMKEKKEEKEKKGQADD